MPFYRIVDDFLSESTGANLQCREVKNLYVYHQHFDPDSEVKSTLRPSLLFRCQTAV